MPARDPSSAWEAITGRGTSRLADEKAVLEFSSMIGISAALLSVAAAVAMPAAKPVLPFVEDDYPAALSRAKSKKLPIFVEAWAPW